MKGYAKLVKENKFYKVRDASAWSKVNLVVLFFQLMKIIVKEKPNIVITTGAAPGLFAIIIARFFGAKTIWLDSIANNEQLSLSGKIARPFSHLHLTQWEQLTNNKTVCLGKVL